eukprot:10102384-Prorocentrum_lima.AAC.1
MSVPGGQCMRKSMRTLSGRSNIVGGLPTAHSRIQVTSPTKRLCSSNTLRVIDRSFRTTLSMRMS